MNRPDIVARRIGEERQPVAVVDGFHPDPEQLRAHAQASAFEPARHHYPGIRAPLSAGYFARVRPVLTTVLRDVFGHAGPIDLIDASYSIVTTQPAELTVEQRLPHVDAVTPGRIALVHYLAQGDGSGTSFFRHRATGYETIDEGRSEEYLRQLNAEVRNAPPLRAYVNDSTPLFEQIASVEARFNRAVIYRSALLHSGAIQPSAKLDPDPLAGRLTVTAFLSTA